MKIRLKFGIFVVKGTGVDQEAYLKAQMVEACTSPLNMAGTMQEHGCDVQEVLRHRNWLMEHFATYGGAEWAAEKLRPKFVKEVEIPLHIYLLNRFQWLHRPREFMGRIFGGIASSSIRIGLSRPVYRVVDAISRLS